MKIKLSTGAICACLTALSFNVGAATVSYSDSTGVIGLTGSLSLQQFDSSLGTLSGVSIEWDSGFNGTFRVVSETQVGTASGLDGFISHSITTTSSPAGTVGPSLNSSAGTAFNVSVPPSYNQFFSGGQADSQTFGPLASFIGPGTLSYDFIGMASDTTTASDGLLRGITGHQYLINADITYTYTIPAVPVPAAVWLFASGLLGLVGVARHKKS